MYFTLLRLLNKALSAIPHKTIGSALVYVATILLQKYIPGITEDQILKAIQEISVYGFNIGLFSWRLSDYVSRNS